VSTNFPTSLDTFTDPTGTEATNSVSHAGQHTNANDAIAALEAKVGVNSSSVSTSLDYKISRAALLQENVNTVSSSGTAVTIPAVTTATINRVTLTGNCTLTFPAPLAGTSFVLELIQDGTGSRTVAWPSTVKWASGAAPTLSATAGYRDLTTFLCADGATWFGNLAGLGYR